ncbi:di-heme oxidoredictase family protein [Mameliella sp. AT18]|uniref:di-heme oxidoreductase family protein n=1 Tax=Mameliella sp. AT18 TaxID=3028385 RepID=UPI0008410AFF|nr:di-heme oxidoredictase family protein [Mameliella sp. AT18]MDD9733730.1 di-heme oxidoredictase family protein [Mameliella sp. AT18]ODM49705.1 thiol oxidoreductase [Ruegeria sp. PBVC088]
MKPSKLACLAVLIGPAAVAGPLDEPHLKFTPRTPAEDARIAKVLAPPTEFGSPERFEDKPAGAATVRVTPDANAFSLPSASLDFEDELTFKVGNGLFRKIWVSSPSSTLASDGLGPLYNARSCQRCHIKDGRGHPPESHDDSAVSMFLRVSVPGGPDDMIPEIEGYIASAPEPTYGTQLQDFSLPGHAAEYRLQVDYKEITVPLSGGESATLRKPTYTAADLGYGPLHPKAMLSPRVAPQMIGLGLLEAIPAAEILAGADPGDANDDGISGRANIVWSVEFDMPMLGRFGHKAGNPTILEQTAAAFVGDIGISSPLFPAGAGECTDLQADCQAAPHGGGDARGFEVDAEGLELTAFYSRNLGVPARRNMDDSQVLRGKQVFHNTGCAACHRPKFVTHRLPDRPEHSFQLIWPYTDMLLHDMGAGLADGRPEARATGREWRTAPLWGIGLTEQVSGHTTFLHDGRAQSLLEAILWHGGEAQSQRDAVTRMPPPDRNALIAFLESL